MPGAVLQMCRNTSKDGNDAMSIYTPSETDSDYIRQAIFQNMQAARQKSRAFVPIVPALPLLGIDDITPVKVAPFKGMDKRFGSCNVCCNGNVMNIAKP